MAKDTRLEEAGAGPKTGTTMSKFRESEAASRTDSAASAGAYDKPIYKTASIYDRDGNLIEVYSEGPNAGKSVETGQLVIQGEDPVAGDFVASQEGDGKELEEGFVDPKDLGKLLSTYVDPDTGDIIDVYEGGEKVRKPGTKRMEADAAAKAAAEDKRRAGQSAYDILYSQFSQYGLGSLMEPLKDLITSGASPAEFTIKLRESEPYKKRFAANAQRVAKGLKALDEAAYIEMEDQYQNIMRSYGLPDTYWAKDTMGTQEGFTKLLASDVSAVELENRVQQAADVIDKGPKEYLDAIKQFYPDVQRGDLMAYVLDPKNAITQIQSKIGAAKIGGEYLRAGINAPGVARAEALLKEGVTAEKARAGAQAIKETAPRGSELSALYGQGPYGQAEVEEEVYGLGKATEAKRKREKVSELEQASFGKRTGITSTALSRNSAY